MGDFVVESTGWDVSSLSRCRLRKAQASLLGESEGKPSHSIERSHRYLLASAVLVAVFAIASVHAADFPSVQVVPLPEDQIAFEIDGKEVARYYANPDAPKPYLFPLIGPSGKRLTSMAHPVDPYGHRHHRSVWIGHADVNGYDFWAENNENCIVFEKLVEFGSSDDAASFTVVHVWRAADGVQVLRDTRTWTLRKIGGGEYYLDLVLILEPIERAVTFGATPFGLLGVRVALTMTVAAGGGRILNAQGKVNESEVHWQNTEWVDFSGRVAPDAVNGIALFNHPGNPGHPPAFHVRDEGWMSPCFTKDAPLSIEIGERLTLRYRLYVHDAEGDVDRFERHWLLYRDEPVAR